MSEIDYLSELVVADGHNDLPWQMRVRYQYDFDASGFDSSNGKLHTDGPRLSEGKVGFQFWSAFVPSHLSQADSVIHTLEQIEFIHRLVERSPNFALVESAQDALQVMERGQLAGMIGVEGGHSLGGSLGVLRVFRRLGVRYLTLTHNDSTEWAESATGEPVAEGLTELGVQFIHELNVLGVIVDLSHVSEKASVAALEHTTRPPILSHSNCRSLVDHPRNATDSLIQKVADASGVIMLTFVPAFLRQDVADYEEELAKVKSELGFGTDFSETSGSPSQTAAETLRGWMRRNPEPRSSIDDVVAHLEHARDLVGIDHIGIGSDFDGIEQTPLGLEDVSKYPVLAETLRQKGWSDKDLHSLFYRNTLRVISEND